MPQRYSRNELVEMLLAIGRADKNFNEAIRLYMRRFPKRRHPNANNPNDQKMTAQVLDTKIC